MPVNELEVVAKEGKDYLLTGPLELSDGTPVSKAQLTALTLTLMVRDTWEVINNRNGQDILDANGGTVDDDGTIRLLLQNEDNVVTDPEIPVGEYEYHRVRIEFTVTIDGQSVDNMTEVDLAVEKIATPVA